MEEIEQFVSFMTAYELKTFLDDIYEVTGESHDSDFNICTILNYLHRIDADYIIFVGWSFFYFLLQNPSFLCRAFRVPLGALKDPICTSKSFDWANTFCL
jgi:hypothetical protein